MRNSISLVFGTFLALLAGCSSSETPVFGELQHLSSPSSGEVTGPRFSTGADGNLTLSWMEPAEHGTRLRYSQLVDGEFASARDVATEPRMFVNWADLPSVMHVEGRHWIAHWLRYSAEKTYSYDVVVSQSFDDGNTWSDAVTAHTDGTPTEHGFVSMHRDLEGVALLWLDGRNTPDAPMTLRSAIVTPEGTLSQEHLIDDSVCDCCQTDVAVSAAGPLVVYRNRTSDETRDIYITRFSDGVWEAGAPLYDDNWVIPGCPVNGPAIVARGNQVAVAWFSAANDEPVVRVVWSTDGGTTFGSPVDVAAGHLAGYVGLALLDDQSLAVSWVGRNVSGSNSLNLSRVSPTGQIDSALAIADIEQLRVFPQLGYQDGSLYLAWTDEDDKTRRLSVVRVPVPPT